MGKTRKTIEIPDPVAEVLVKGAYLTGATQTQLINCTLQNFLITVINGTLEQQGKPLFGEEVIEEETSEVELFVPDGAPVNAIKLETTSGHKVVNNHKTSADIKNATITIPVNTKAGRPTKDPSGKTQKELELDRQLEQFERSYQADIANFKAGAITCIKKLIDEFPDRYDNTISPYCVLTAIMYHGYEGVIPEWVKTAKRVEHGGLIPLSVLWECYNYTETVMGGVIDHFIYWDVFVEHPEYAQVFVYDRPFLIQAWDKAQSECEPGTSPKYQLYKVYGKLVDGRLVEAGRELSEQ